MNPQSFTIAERLIPSTYLQQALVVKKTREHLVRTLIEQRKWQEEGWDDASIELFMTDLAQMDSNNYPSKCTVGEREGRFACALVAKRHFRMGHGTGRSGDMGEVQPKAVGSSLLIKILNVLLVDSVRLMGVTNAAGCFMLPVATSMSLVICMLTMKQDRPGAKFVIWPRMDQKSCFKSILTAGLQPIIIESCTSGDELKTDLVSMEAQMATLGSDNIVCVLTTTSCFAPRCADSLEQVAILCSRYNIPHLVNNAYGLQSNRLMNLISEASKKGRVDAFVQSADKNFLVPVGGAIVSGFDKPFLEKILRTYPGRASASSSVDVFITMLSLGVNGFKDMLASRKEMFKYLKDELTKLAERHGERLLDTKNNPISVAMTLNSLLSTTGTTSGSGYPSSSNSNSVIDNKRLHSLNSALFLRCVSGCRVITCVEQKEVCGYKFEGWGAHNAHYRQPYLTASAAMGVRKADIDLFIQKLDKTMHKVKKKTYTASASGTSAEEITSMGSSSRRSATRINGNSSTGDPASSASTSLASSKDSLRKQQANN